MAFDTAVIYVRGYIGQDVKDLRKDKKGKEYCSFSVCVTTGKNMLTWYQCKVYGDIGINLVKKGRILKGKEAMIKGIPSLSTWKQNGNTRVSFNIFCDWVCIQDKVLEKVEHQRDLDLANDIDEDIPDEVVQDLNSEDVAPF